MCTRCVQKLTSFVGEWLGLIDGAFDGDDVGISVGEALGEPEGDSVGFSDCYERERDDNHKSTSWCESLMISRMNTDILDIHKIL